EAVGRAAAGGDDADAVRCAAGAPAVGREDRRRAVYGVGCVGERHAVAVAPAGGERARHRDEQREHGEDAAHRPRPSRQSPAVAKTGRKNRAASYAVARATTFAGGLAVFFRSNMRTRRTSKSRRNTAIAAKMKRGQRSW